MLVGRLLSLRGSGWMGKGWVDLGGLAFLCTVFSNGSSLSWDSLYLFFICFLFHLL